MSKTSSKQWYEKHKDDPSYQERKRIWIKNNREKRRANAQKYRSNNRELLRRKSREWAAHRDIARCRAAKWLFENRERRIGTRRRHYRNNKNLFRLKSHLRRLHKRSQRGSVSGDIIKYLLVKQDGYCNSLFCSVDIIFDPYHLDHKIPLALGGKHDDSNLQLLCAKCNLSKGAKHPDSLWELGR